MKNSNKFTLGEIAVEALIDSLKDEVENIRPLVKTPREISDKEELVARAMLMCGYAMAIRWLKALGPTPVVSYDDLEEELAMQIARMKDGEIDMDSFIGKEPGE